MSVSRRNFVGNGLALGLLASMLPPEAAEALAQLPQTPTDPAEAPHDALDFWGGFFDEVNPHSSTYGKQTRGAAALPDPALQTQYLHYHTDSERLRYATDIEQNELLDHDGDVAVTIALAQFRPGHEDQKVQPSQLRVDATQVNPLMNLFAPLAWTAIASLSPNNAGKIPSLDQLGFRSEQATTATSRILLTSGTGKLAVNISRAPNDSGFLKVLKVMMVGLKAVAPLVTLPAISIPALSAFSEAFAYWEDRTRFIMNGNLVHAVATRQALADPEREPAYIGLVSGDYVMVPRKHTEELAAELPNLHLAQGYLVRKDADMNQPITARADSAVPGITYATMRVSVMPLDTQAGAARAESSSGDSGSPGSSSSSSKKKSGSGSGSNSGTGSHPKH